MQKTTIVKLLAFSFLVANAYAADMQMVSATAKVKGLAQVLDGASHASTMKVLFPKKIPAAKMPSQLYASFMSYAVKPNFNQFWQINVGATATCKGAHFCNIGSMSAEKDKALTTSFGGEMPTVPKQNKTSITLQDGTTAYFTPAHAEGDFHPATIEWQMNHVLYTLTWNIKGGDEKETLTTMANSSL